MTTVLNFRAQTLEGFDTMCDNHTVLAANTALTLVHQSVSTGRDDSQRPSEHYPARPPPGSESFQQYQSGQHEWQPTPQRHSSASTLEADSPTAASLT